MGFHIDIECKDSSNKSFVCKYSYKASVTRPQLQGLILKASFSRPQYSPLWKFSLLRSFQLPAPRSMTAPLRPKSIQMAVPLYTGQKTPLFSTPHKLLLEVFFLHL